MPRVKDNGKIVEGLATNMKSFAQAVEEKFPNVVYTSGRRDASQKVGKNYKHSHHNTGDALDISGRNPEVYEYLTKDPEGQALMRQYGYELIDETNPEMMKKTGATGPHYHIEPAGKGSQPQQQQQMPEQFEPLNNYDAFKVIQAVKPEGSYTTVEDIQKEAYKEAKVENSEARQSLKEIQEVKKQAVDQALARPEQEQLQEQPQEQQNQEQKLEEYNALELTTSVEPLQKLFKVPHV